MGKDRARFYESQEFFIHGVSSCFKQTDHLVCLPYLARGVFTLGFVNDFWLIFNLLLVCSMCKFLLGSISLHTKWPAKFFSAERQFFPGRWRSPSQILSQWGFSGHRCVSAQLPHPAPLLVSLRFSCLIAPSSEAYPFPSAGKTCICSSVGLTHQDQCTNGFGPELSD